MNWRPLSVRRGRREPSGPHEGVPQHLVGPLTDWLYRVFDLDSPFGGREEQMRDLALSLECPVPPYAQAHDVFRVLLRHGERSDEDFLDVIDGALARSEDMRIASSGAMLPSHASMLESLLSRGGSVWAVASGGESLTNRVDEMAQAAYDSAAAPSDAVSDELSEAWGKAFGRDPDASDAWDHAIKAVEHVLVPVVVPKKDKATLGDVLGQLSGQDSHVWQFVLPGHDQSHDVAPLVAMLRLTWPNLDRHGGGPSRTPSIDEARAVVQIAVTVAQWQRNGWVVTKR